MEDMTRTYRTRSETVPPIGALVEATRQIGAVTATYRGVVTRIDLDEVRLGDAVGVNLPREYWVFRAVDQDTPVLVSTVEDYTNLPENTILEMVSETGWGSLFTLIRKVGSTRPLFKSNYGYAEAFELVSCGVTCRVVEYGGTT